MEYFWVLAVVLALLGRYITCKSDTEYREKAECQPFEFECKAGEMLHVVDAAIVSNRNTEMCDGQIFRKKFDCRCSMQQVAEYCNMKRSCDFWIFLEPGICGECVHTKHYYVKYRCLNDRLGEDMPTFRDRGMLRNRKDIMIKSYHYGELTNVPKSQCRLDVKPGTKIQIEVLDFTTNKKSCDDLSLWITRVTSGQPEEDQPPSICPKEFPHQYGVHDDKVNVLTYVYIRPKEITSNSNYRAWLYVSASEPIDVHCGLGLQTEAPNVFFTPLVPGRTPSSTPERGKARIPGMDRSTRSPTTTETKNVAVDPETNKAVANQDGRYTVVVGSLVGTSVLLGCLILYALILLFYNTLRKHRNPEHGVTGMNTAPLRYTNGTLASTTPSAIMSYPTFGHDGRLEIYPAEKSETLATGPRVHRSSKSGTRRPSVTSSKSGQRKGSIASSTPSISARVDHIVLPSKQTRHKYQTSSRRPSGSESHASVSHITDTTVLSANTSKSSVPPPGSAPDARTWAQAHNNLLTDDDIYESIDKYDKRGPLAGHRRQQQPHGTTLPNNATMGQIFTENTYAPNFATLGNPHLTGLSSMPSHTMPYNSRL